MAVADTRHGVDRCCTTLPTQQCHLCSLPLFCHPWRGPLAQISKGGFSRVGL